MIPATLLAGLALVQGDASDIWSRLHFDANGRMRAEATFDQPSGEDRYRGRMRFRIGASYDIMETLTAKARLSTASDGRDANNPHWDFGDGSDSFQGGDLVFDRFFLDWTPCECSDFRVGKIPHVLAQPPVFSELMWDQDVNPTGIGAIWDVGSSGDFSGDLRLAEYIAVENSSQSDPAMFGVQGNLRWAAEEDLGIDLSTSFSAWSNLNDSTGQLGNQGNTDVMGDFGIWESFLAATFEGGPLGRTQGFVEYMNNVDDDTGEDTGFAIGVKAGKGGHQGDKNVFLTWYDLDANAVFSPVAQDDTPIAGTGVGTGMTGVIVGGQYYVRDNVSLKLWVLTSDADAAEDPVRVRFDLDFTVN